MADADNFRQAVEWLAPICEHRLGQPQLGPLVLSEMLWAANLGIWQECPGGPHSVSATAAERLFYEAKSDPGAFDLLTRVSVGLLLHDRPLHQALRLFAVERLTGAAQRPVAPRAAHTNGFNLYNFVLIVRASQDFTLPMTRNVASQPHSACDALSAAFHSAGRTLKKNHAGTSYASLVKLFEARHSDLRERAAQIVVAVQGFAWPEMKKQMGLPDIFDPPQNSVPQLDK